MFDHIIPSNSTMVGEIFETLGYEIPKNAMKSHPVFLLTSPWWEKILKLSGMKYLKMQ